MAKKVTSGENKENPITSESVQTQYAMEEHSNPITNENVQTQYARIMDNTSDLKGVVLEVDQMVKDVFPNASEESRITLITKLMDKI
ncbi:hypothetical protein JMN32_15185 [Fulvivirga sp. 29W222]|uniref:Uncharacterized protein n=1 Tax=Fulvivirga marina TaxID=2494733 RepID=A0A937G0C7_9BACT|nr:hypothetical protein [Fulvivirga marina]MBL6447660.1 hypothetical protein [Fulvivirga marina]